MNTIIMTEECWANTYLSIARQFGQINVNGMLYEIVNKEGITVMELSSPESKHYVGDNAMGIPPGEPADLVRADWVPVYRKLGRERFIEIVKQGLSLEEAKKIAEEEAE